MPSEAQQEALQIIRKLGVVRPRDLEAHGIPRSRIYRLVKMGLVERQARGLYALRDHAPTAEHALAQVAKKVPKGVICLISALQFHELTTQLPHEIWVAIPEKARKPILEYPPVRFVRFSTPTLTQGVEVHSIEGVPVRITSVAKTLADCFKYRNKIGLDVVLQALREAWTKRQVTMDDIDRYARLCRVDRVMQPYLEALVA